MIQYQILLYKQTLKISLKLTLICWTQRRSLSLRNMTSWSSRTNPPTFQLCLSNIVALKFLYHQLSSSRRINFVPYEFHSLFLISCVYYFFSFTLAGFSCISGFSFTLVHFFFIIVFLFALVFVSSIVKFCLCFFYCLEP
jgi:hypothetical protein